MTLQSIMISAQKGEYPGCYGITKKVPNLVRGKGSIEYQKPSWRKMAYLKVYVSLAWHSKWGRVFGAEEQYGQIPTDELELGQPKRIRMAGSWGGTQ